MTVKHPMSRQAVNQLSMGKIVLLSLLPGLMSVLFALLAAPLVQTMGAPPLLAKLLGNALFIGLCELAFLLVQGKRTTGTVSLRGVVDYRERLPGGRSCSGWSLCSPGVL